MKYNINFSFVGPKVSKARANIDINAMILILLFVKNFYNKLRYYEKEMYNSNSNKPFSLHRGEHRPLTIRQCFCNNVAYGYGIGLSALSPMIAV